MHADPLALGIAGGALLYTIVIAAGGTPILALLVCLVLAVVAAVAR